jgi:hypothetical protein
MTPTDKELQSLALRIARHEYPLAKHWYVYEPYAAYTHSVDDNGNDRYRFIYIDSATMHPLWEGIVDNYLEIRIEYHKATSAHGTYGIYALEDVIEASKTPVGIARAYCEVYGLEDDR